MNVVIEVLATPAVLGKTCYAWMALAIVTDATEVSSSHIGEECRRAFQYAQISFGSNL
jgi:hypothetical protein